MTEVSVLDDASPPTVVTPMSRSGQVFAAAAGFVVLASLYLGSSGLTVSPMARFIVSEVVFLIPLVSATVSGWLVFRSAAGPETRFWLLMTIGNALLVTCEIYYSWWIVFARTVPPPVYAPFQIMHLIGGGVFFAMLLTMTKFPYATSTVKWRYAMDWLGIAAVLFVAFLKLVVDPMFSGLSSVLPVERLAGAGYLTFGAVMLSATLSTLLGFKVARWRPWEKLVAASIGIYTVGVMAWPLWLVTYKVEGSSIERGLIDLVLVLGHYLFLVATVLRLKNKGQQWPLRPMPLFQSGGRFRFKLMAGAVSIAAIPVFTLLGIGSRPGSLEYWVYLVATSWLAVLVVVRTTIVSIDNGHLLHWAVTDPLTGLFNLRFLHQRLAVELDIARRYGEQLSLAVLDLDDFTQANVLYGHAGGDEVLRDAAAAVMSSCRDSDTVCRVGADEFAVLMPDTGSKEAAEACNRIRAGLAQPNRGRAVTASFGVAVYPRHAATADQLLSAARGAFFWVKRHGKDNVLVHSSTLVTDPGEDDRIHTLEAQAHVGAVRALAAAVDARDPATQHHSSRVASLAVRVGRELGFEDDRISLLESAALMHDVGKIGVPDHVLSRLGAYSDEDFAHFAEHPALGERILASTPFPEILPWIRHHHERWDGAGFPDGLRAVAIPLEARILAVCEAHDSWTSPRPWRPAMPEDQALAELIVGMGTRFDPAVVEVFLLTQGLVSPSA